ncbi:MAG TPA: hypothetical protein VGF80_02225 [Galbitalea sp.]
MSGNEPQGTPAGGSSLSSDDAPTGNDGTSGADTAAGDARTAGPLGHSARIEDAVP